MGVTIRQKNLDKGDKRWWAFIHHRNKTQSVCLKTADRKKAKRIANEIGDKMVRGEWDLLPREIPTVAEYITRYLKQGEGRLADSSQRNYKSLLNHIIPYIGHLPIDRVTPGDIKDMAPHWNRTLKYRSRTNVYGMLIMVFKAAIEDDYIRKTPVLPMARVLGKRVDMEVAPERVITAEHLGLILDFAMNKLPWPYGPFFFFLAQTGLRCGEAMGLDWENVSLLDGTAEIVQSWSNQFGMGPTKTKRRRVIDLTPQTIALLRDLKRQVDEMDLSSGRTAAGKPIRAVFVGPRGGQRLSKVVVQRHWHRIRDTLSLPPYRVNDLRHTCASRMLDSGMSVVEVSQHLGHSTPRTTLEVYLHVMPDRNRLKVDCLDSGYAYKGMATKPEPFPSLTRPNVRQLPFAM